MPVQYFWHRHKKAPPNGRAGDAWRSGSDSEVVHCLDVSSL